LRIRAKDPSALPRQKQRGGGVFVGDVEKAELKAFRLLKYRF